MNRKTTRRLLVFLLIAAVATAAGGESTVRRGMSLADALAALEGSGLRVVFTDRLVRPSMRIDAEPRADGGEALLAELLGPHGLRAEPVKPGLYRVVPARRPSPEIPEAVLSSIPVVADAIEVRATRPWILGDELSTLSLEREDLMALPHVGDDTFRALTLLPGVSSDDASAKLSVRGGREDELLVLLDGVEILEPYHLRDFNSFLSVLPPQIIDSVELLTGGFSAEYGDRMSGVLNLTSVTPRAPRHFEVGLSPLDLRLTTSAGGDGGRHLVNLRSGTLEIPFRFADQAERPVFGDFFAKAERSTGESREHAAGFLLSVDRLRFSQTDDGEEEAFSTRYRNAYAWATEQHVRSDVLLSTTRATGTAIRRDRRGQEQDEDVSFDLRDDRSLDVFGLEQDWIWQWRPEHVLKWGAELRRSEATYDYAVTLRLDGPRIGGGGAPSTFLGAFDGWQAAAYVSQSLRPTERLGLVVGLRFDRNTILDDNWVLHPRFAANFRISDQTRLAFSWGEYSQSQRLYELQVEDGVTDFARAEQARYTSIGLETQLPGHGVAFKRRPLALRVEIYRRDVGNPRPRFENLFDPISKVPELENDRFGFRPERTISQGIELFVGGAWGRSVDGFLSYAYADAFDRIEGAEVPRLNSQEHTFRFDLVWHTPWRWDVQFAWRSRSGRPTTPVASSTRDGDTVPRLGPTNSGSLPDYHRLDVRFSRSFALPNSELEVFALVHNALGRRNLRGFSVSFKDGEDVEIEPETWGSILPTFGIRWRF